MNRKKFLKSTILMGGASLMLSSLKNEIEATLFTAEEIDEFVGAAHSSLGDTKKILEEKPLILNCASQIAKGDFETAMGGASHMGRKDIVDLLISHGARMDIFTFSFLGYADFIKEMIKKNPQLLHSYGPHGFTLLHHAKAGKHAHLEKWLYNQGLEKDIFDDVFTF